VQLHVGRTVRGRVNLWSDQVLSGLGQSWCGLGLDAQFEEVQRQLSPTVKVR
jgi:hypothetical protein